MIYLGADHAGWQLKEELKKYLAEKGRAFEDVSKPQLDPADDYPDFALLVARRVADTENLGILFCATGIGMCLAANKIAGIRAALCWNEATARQSRQHNNANVLCLGAQAIDPELIRKIVNVWLETEFSGEERHMRRLKKVEEMAK